MPFENLSI